MLTFTGFFFTHPKLLTISLATRAVGPPPLAAARRMQTPLSDSHVEYIALVAGGDLTNIAADAIAQHLGLPRAAITQVGLPPASANWVIDNTIPRHIFAGEAGVAKLHIWLPRPVDSAGWVAQHEELASLQCVQGLLAPLATASDIALATDEAMAQAERVVQSTTRWEAAVRTWRYCQPTPPPLTASDEADGSSGGLTFRASAIRDGTHSFTAPELAGVVGSAVHRCRGLAVSLKSADLEVVVILLQSELVMGLNLWPGKSYSRGKVSSDQHSAIGDHRSAVSDQQLVMRDQ